MIKYNPKDWNALIYFKGSLLRKLFRGMVLITVITVVLGLLHLKYGIINIQMSAALPGYMGAALGLLLVFRNNTAYDKWWEGRKELGSLVNISRNFAITLNGFLPSGSKEKVKISNLVIIFIYTLKEHLRTKKFDYSEAQELLESHDYELVKNAQHKPNVIVNLIMQEVEKLYHANMISQIQQLILINQVSVFIDVLGKCERIRNTPIPIAYAVLLKMFIYIYVIILPLGLINSIGWWAVPLVMILYYILMSIVLTAEEIEEPFGTDLNDLPLDEVALNLKNNIREIVAQH